MNTLLHAPSASCRTHRRRGARNLNPTVLLVLAFPAGGGAACAASDAMGQGEPCVLVSLSGAPATRDLGGARMLLRREHWERLKEAEATCWTARPDGRGHYYVSSGAWVARRLAAGAGADGRCVDLSSIVRRWSGLVVPRGCVIRFRNGDALDLRPGNLEVVRRGVQRGTCGVEPPPRLVVQQ